MRSATLIVTSILVCLSGGVARAQDQGNPVSTKTTGTDATTPAAEDTAAVSDVEAPAAEDTALAPDADATAGESATAPPEQTQPGVQEDASYNIKLRAIEERVNDLKEKIFQSKARLIQLQEVVLHGTITGAKAVLIHRNEMGSSFKLHRVKYSLDGAPIFNRADSGQGELSELEEIEIFDGSIAPGNHRISVYLEYNGHGFGVFSYLQGYKFKIKSSYAFTAEEGKLTTLRIIGYEKGGLTTQLKDRPSVQYKQEVSRELRREDVAGTAPSADSD